MNFSWDEDQRRIHPLWPDRSESFPTFKIPSSQKNKKVQQIPLLPGLQSLLESVPMAQRHGWVVNPAPIDVLHQRTEQPAADIKFAFQPEHWRFGELLRFCTREETPPSFGPLPMARSGRINCASAHDRRRSCDFRLINAGVSAKTLTIVLRHEGFKTTEKPYGAIRKAQSAALEIQKKLSIGCNKGALVKGLMGKRPRAKTY